MRAQSGAESVATPWSIHARSAGSNPAPRSIGHGLGHVAPHHVDEQLVHRAPVPVQRRLGHARPLGDGVDGHATRAVLDEQLGGRGEHLRPAAGDAGVQLGVRS